jgi:hypothetical protein
MDIFIEGYVICKLLLNMYVKVTPSVLSSILQYQFPDDGQGLKHVGYLQ